MSDFIYLASQSPRRQELLKQIGVRYEMLLPVASEDAESIETPFPKEKALDYVKRVTLAKASFALERWKNRNLPWAPILCADTTVSLPNNESGEILGKPTDATDAYRILEMLSGKTHEVLTAVALINHPEDAPNCVVQISEVEFANLSSEQIHTYIASQEPFGKAGAYGVQGRASAFISRINGSYSGIMGLPLFETVQLLDHARITRI